MKLSKRGWIVTAMAALAIATISLAIVYVQQSRHQQELNEELARIQSNLDAAQISMLVSDKTGLEARLGEASARLETVKTVFTSKIESSIIVQSLFDIARDHNVEITDLTSSTPSKQNLSGVNFAAIVLTAHVQGNSSAIIDFVIDMNNHFNTGITSSAMVTITSDSNGDGSAVDLRMTIYSYQEGI